MKIFLLNGLNLKALTNVSALSFDESSEILSIVEIIDRENMKYSWSGAQWSESKKSTGMILCVNKDKGFVLFNKTPGDAVLHLLKIVIKPDCRGHGIAQEIFQESLIIARSLHCDTESVYLEVEDDNQRAIGFYKKLAFEKIHQKKKYYSDGSGAIFMQKLL